MTLRTWVTTTLASTSWMSCWVWKSGFSPSTQQGYLKDPQVHMPICTTASCREKEVLDWRLKGNLRGSKTKVLSVTGSRVGPGEGRTENIFFFLNVQIQVHLSLLVNSHLLAPSHFFFALEGWCPKSWTKDLHSGALIAVGRARISIKFFQDGF